MKVGFIGLGVMGGPMALNVLRGGHELTVHDRSPEAVARLTAAGAKAAATPKEVGAASAIVVTMLPEPQHVEQVALGPDGIAAGMKRGGLVIDMSTIDPVTSQRVGKALKELGIDMVDSPVGKTSEHAVSGTLTLMVGGEPQAIERALPVLKCMGTDTFLCGGPGMGHAMKITNNLLATTIMVANTEVLAIGVKAGLKLELMMEVMKTTMAFNHQLHVAMPKTAFVGDDSPGFMVKLAGKDVRLAAELAKAYGFDALVGRAAQQSLEHAAQMGYAERDTAALMKIREDELGLSRRGDVMPAYVINDMEITDPVRFEEYKKLSPATVAQYGGRFLARGGAVEPLEGDWSPKRLVILEFPSVAQARAWVDSTEYAPARRLRQLSAKSNLIVVEGVAAG